jgi:hypothetical protein
MQTLAEVCGSAVAFTYRSIDRLILNAYIPTLQTPGAVARFLREVCGRPILSPVAFKALTDRFAAEVQSGSTRSGPVMDEPPPLVTIAVRCPPSPRRHTSRIWKPGRTSTPRSARMERIARPSTVVVIGRNRARGHAAEGPRPSSSGSWSSWSPR